MDSSSPPPADESTRRQLRHHTFTILVFWLVVMGLLYAGMRYYLQPRDVEVTAEGSLVIPRDRDGHFYMEGQVNGVPVTFMVDTGASLIAVTDAVARRAGLEGGRVTRFRTANGEREGRVVVADTVSVRSFSATNLRVGTGYTGESADDALLGQNFLRQFDVRIERDRIVLQPR